MATWKYSGVEYGSPTASQVDFNLTTSGGDNIPYLSGDHIEVYTSTDSGKTWTKIARGSGSTEWDFKVGDPKVVTFNTAPGTAKDVRLIRNTPYKTKFTTFQEGSLLTSDQLNDGEDFSMYVDQELYDKTLQIKDDDGNVNDDVVIDTADQKAQTTNWTDNDAKLATAGAIAFRHDNVIGDGTSYPGAGNKGQRGKLRIDNSTTPTKMFWWDESLGTPAWVEITGNKGTVTEVKAGNGISVKDPNTTPEVSVKLNSTSPGLVADSNGLRTDGNQTGIGTVQFGSGDTYTFPTADGNSGDTLQTDGSGTLKWAAPGSGTLWTRKSTSPTRLHPTNTGDAVILGAATDSVDVGQTTGALQIAGTSGAQSSLTLRRNTDTSSAAPYLVLGRGRGTAVDDNDAVNGNNLLGGIYFAGNDGTDCNTIAAAIEVDAEGTIAGNRVPGRIEFKTATDAASSSLKERMRIDSAGRVLIGTTTSVDNTYKLQVVGTKDDGERRSMLLRYGQATEDAAQIKFQKNRSDSGGTTSVDDGDDLGQFLFQGTDQGGSYRLAASIDCEADDDPDKNTVPGRLIFYTTPAGSSSTRQERMRINSSGNVRIGTSTVETKLQVDLAAPTTTADGSDFGANMLQLKNTSSAAAGAELLIAGSHSTGPAGIGSAIGFGRHNTSDWGTYISFKTHSPQTSNMDELTERARINSAGELIVNGTKSGQLTASTVDALILDTGATTAAVDRGSMISFRCNNDNGKFDAGGIQVAKASGGGTTRGTYMRFITRQENGTMLERGRVDDGGKWIFRNNAGGTNGTGQFSINMGDDTSNADGILNVKNAGNRGAKGHASGSPLMKLEFKDERALELNKDGRLLVGKEAEQTPAAYGSAVFQVSGPNPQRSSGLFMNFADGNSSQAIILAKRRQFPGPVANGGRVVDGDELGHVSWQGWDGTQLREAARITGEADSPTDDSCPGHLKFATAKTGGTMTEWMRITNAGTIKLLNNSPGIQFPAGTSGGGITVQNNLLDDYEEGSWTPTWAGGVKNPAYSTQKGQYTKIGRQVTCSFQISLGAGSQANGTHYITTLPFAVSDDHSHDAVGGGLITFNTVICAGKTLQGYVVNGQKQLNLYYDGNSTATDANNTAINGSNVFGVVSYFTDT